LAVQRGCKIKTVGAACRKHSAFHFACQLEAFFKPQVFLERLCSS
jgi:hypothetical protein